MNESEPPLGTERRVEGVVLSGAIQSPPAINSSRTLFATVFRVEGLTTPRYRAKLEQWIVANLCNRKTEDIFRWVDRNSGWTGSRRISDGRS